MNRYEKIAWFNLAVTIVTITIYVVLFALLFERFGPARASRVALSSFSLLAIIAFAPMIFKTTNRGDMVLIDDQGTIIRYPYRRFLIAGILFSIIYAFVLFLLVIMKKLNTRSLMLSLSAFWIIAFILLFMYGRQKKRSSFKAEDKTADVFQHGPDMDERDLAIMQKARWVGFGVFWFFFVFGLVGLSVWMSPQGGKTVTIDVQLAPLALWPSFLLILTSQSIATIVLYRRDTINGES